MEDAKPDFLQFAKLQNEQNYLLTGVITNSKTGISYAERNYARTKCVFDFILLAACLTLVLCGMRLMAAVSLPVYSQIHTVEYNPNIGEQVFLLELLKYLCLNALYFVIAPIALKLARLVFSLRWWLVSFEMGGSQNGAVSYYEYYNSVVDFPYGNLFWSVSQKKKTIIDGYYQGRHIRIPYRGSISLCRLITGIFIYCAGFLFVWKGMWIAPVLYGSLALVYGLSHIAARYNWKRDCQPGAEQAGTV